MNLEQLAEKIAREHNLAPEVIQAMCKVESSWNPYAIRYESRWKYLLDVPQYANKNGISPDSERITQMCSWGLMQVMGSVARELGYDGPLTKLTNPEIALQLGCKKIAHLLKLHKELPLALQAYNAGKPNTALGIRYSNKVLMAVRTNN